MFINFDPDEQAHCDNCEELGTVMHLLLLHSDSSIDLCANCFTAMAAAFGHAARKLGLRGTTFDHTDAAKSPLT